MLNSVLDRKATYKRDEGKVYDSVLSLPKQVEATWKQKDELEVPKTCKLVDEVVVVGMGGSALGIRVIKTMGGDFLRVPIEIVTDYHLPAYVGEKTLVILSSYSGNTEEVVNAAGELIKRQAQK